MLDVLIKVDKVIRVMTANCVIRAKSFFFFSAYYKSCTKRTIPITFFFYRCRGCSRSLIVRATIRAILDMQAAN